RKSAPSNRKTTKAVSRSMTKWSRNVLSILIFLTLVVPTQAKLVVCSNADNDLFRLLPEAQRVATPGEAIERADDGSGVLILADNYPRERTKLPADLFDRARAKHLRLYVEYPSELPGLNFHLGETRIAAWERGVITGNAFGDALPKLRIVAPHDCRWIPI